MDGNELISHSGKKEIKAALSCYLLFTRMAIIKKSEGSNGQNGSEERGPGCSQWDCKGVASGTTDRDEATHGAKG